MQSEDTGFQRLPKTAMIWVTVASLPLWRKTCSHHQILFAGFDLGNGGLTTHPAHQRRSAQFIEFLVLVSRAYPDQRVLMIIESGAVPITRAVWEHLDST